MTTTMTITKRGGETVGAPTTTRVMSVTMRIEKTVIEKTRAEKTMIVESANVKRTHEARR